MSDHEGGSESCDDTGELQRVLFEEKQKNLSQFVSHWEVDENDVCEATEEDKEGDPVKRFLWAAEMGNTNLLDEMIRKDHQLIFARDIDGYTALHRSVYEGKKEATEFLLARGADVNTVTNDGWTALHSSSFWGQIEITDLLLRWKKCDVNAKTAGLQTPLHLAAQNANNLPLFQLLLMHPNVKPAEVNRVGEKPADIAARNIKYHDLFIISDESINVL